MRFVPRIIEIITEAEIAMLEHLFGPITVTFTEAVEPQGEEYLPEPHDPENRHRFYAEMMETNAAPVRR